LREDEGWRVAPDPLPSRLAHHYSPPRGEGRAEGEEGASRLCGGVDGHMVAKTERERERERE
jgi:hypothetical protein